MNNEEDDKLSKIYKEAQEDFALGVLNLSEKTRETPSLKNKWLYRIVREEKLLTKMKDTHQELLSQLSAFSRKVQPGAIKAKAESIKTEDLVKLADAIKEQEECVRFLHLILDNQIKSFTWDIKNAIEQTKLENS